MNMLLTILQAAEKAPQDMTWNYLVLGLLIVLAVGLGFSVMRKRQKEF
jgi:LPXTG-motif cell wall-anchored protein